MRILRCHRILKIKFAVMSCETKLENFIDNLETYKQSKARRQHQHYCLVQSIV